MFPFLFFCLCLVIHCNPNYLYKYGSGSHIEYAKSLITFFNLVSEGFDSRLRFLGSTFSSGRPFATYPVKEFFLRFLLYFLQHHPAVSTQTLPDSAAPFLIDVSLHSSASILLVACGALSLCLFYSSFDLFEVFS